jgi:hypothetical protein
MAWETPKTNWYGYTDEQGVYTGDRFNAVDFNRIKNNLEYLREFSVQVYEDYFITSVGEDKTYEDYFYADEINQLEENLNTINNNTIKRPYGRAPWYTANGKTMDFTELNRIEGAILDLYNRLHNEFEGRRMLTWNFGMRGGDL